MERKLEPHGGEAERVSEAQDGGERHVAHQADDNDLNSVDDLLLQRFEKRPQYTRELDAHLDSTAHMPLSLGPSPGQVSSKHA
eukprot:CAMPEP_0119541478 /NCGR_PEP_ID=MMETSP1344-20130328/52978_1 /TAXON_ID=236787 /ORGANISM="Florenciella parvula, Strain CCMP2471" /LENGTH=82 /DNA_ID=CAMNT_0007585459 /DNA_START=548 /DNA_END=796 /DNA_ORIENTATION=+